MTGNSLYESSAKTVFVYTGMGPQWPGMGQDLYLKEKEYKKIIHKCDEIFHRLSGQSFINYMICENPLEAEKNTTILQASNLALQIALTHLWKKKGILPDAVVGHSVGEVAAAYTAKILSLHQAFTITWHRSRLQTRLENKGVMLAVDLSFEELKPLLSSQKRIEIAAINDFQSVTLVGDKEHLDQIVFYAHQKNRFSRFLRVNVPYHSHFMEEVHQEFIESLASLKSQKPRKSIYSSVTGHKINKKWEVSYWWDNIRFPVNFKQSIEQILKDGYRQFVEISPHPTLIKSLQKTLQHTHCQGEILYSIDRKNGAVKTLFSKSKKSSFLLEDFFKHK